MISKNIVPQIKKIKKLLIKNIKWIVLFVCVLVLLEIIQNIFEKEQMRLDNLIYILVVQNMRIEPITAIMMFVTNLASSFFLIFTAFLLYVFIKNKKIGLGIAVNLVVSTIVNFTLKNIIQRGRPSGYMLIDETGYSFPSGHSMASMAFYGLLIYIIWKNVKNKKIKYISTVLLSFLVVLIGFSRIYLGVHYATDVIGGFIVAITYLILFTSLTKAYFNFDPKAKRKKKEGKLDEQNKIKR